ncbi:MAG: PEP-CTERM sorting domain-containing protein [Phycisphaerales bacterium]|nr:PEP-CTERM sorting domain-containing protein [Phycisphaerales bacterium]
MGRIVSNIALSAMAVGMFGLTSTPAHSAVVISYDAATAGSGNEPDDVAPAWSRDGASSFWSNNGTYLDQNVPASTAGSYTSPKVAGTMVKGSSNYTVEFRVRPVSDVGGTPSTDWFARDLVIWTDDVYQYNVIIDKYTTGSSGTGGLRYGGGSYSENLPTLVSGIDWTTPHTIAASYTGSTGNFDIYVDGVLQTTIADSVLKGGNASYAPWQDAVTIGSPTTAGGVVQNEWYYVKVDNTAVPEPATMSLLGVAGLLALRRRR